MSKRPTEIGVGQLALTFGFPLEPIDETQETEDNGLEASTTPFAGRRRPWRKQKWHSLIDKVYALPNLQKAWAKVQANAGAPGVDGIRIRQYRDHADEWLEQLSTDLRHKTYRPMAVRRVYIPKAGGGRRPLGIPAVRDRIVQQAILQILGPIFEEKFSSRSHGFRKDRGCTTALSVVDRAVTYGYEWVVDADIQGFFDNVNHEKMLTFLNEEVADGSLLKLIRHILKAGVIEPCVSEVEPTELGTPQGGPLSPLLANVYLNALDAALVQAGYGLVRYADDFVIFTKSESEAEAALTLARHVLEDELGLTLHPEKTRVVSVDAGFEFLGFHYFRDPKTGGKVKEVRAKSVRSFRAAVRQRTPRLRTQRRFKERHCTLDRLMKNQRVREMVTDLNLYLAGWHGYFKVVWERYTPPFDRFDRFVRTRLRLAITGRVGNGWWNQRITNNLLRDLGLKLLAERQHMYLSEGTVQPARKG